MIIVEAGQRDTRSFDAKILFASQLAQQGYGVVIDETTLPEQIDRSQKYEAAPFLADISEISVTGLVLIGAEDICEEALLQLRSYELSPDVVVSATGRFADYQSLVGSTSKIAFALGREANVIDLNDLQKKQILTSSITPLVASFAQPPKSPDSNPAIFVYLPAEMLDDPMTLLVLGAMDHLPDFQLNLIVSGQGKEHIRKSKYSDLSVFGLSELSPATFAALSDIAVFYGNGVPGDRLANYALDLMGMGGVVVDCTSTAGFVTTGAPALRGPVDPAALSNYLDSAILPNRNEIGRQTKNDVWLESNSVDRLVTALKLPANRRATSNTNMRRKTLFIPTNGNGLGHAQRCTLIASEMDRAANISFAAFPSCINMIRAKGFAGVPLVQKSDDHPEGFANDLVNYLRLKRMLQTGDNLIFDGGYVFDSIYRTILEKSLSATWIRRGLWRPGQIRSSAFIREKAFGQVVVPSEAFEDLNVAYTYGKSIHQVGPIVQQLAGDSDRQTALKKQLVAQFDHPFDELVITMLGGGVAADRSAQLQTLSALFERRPNCLHLIVVWPGSKVSTGLTGWKNTRVVKTRNTLALCQLCDLVISAAGYNSFHEIMYHAIPAIFIPQTAPYMDDQERRARAASERDLAATVLGSEFLLLEREVTAFLDHGKAAQIRQALGSITLPAMGNTSAARIIEQGLNK